MRKFTLKKKEILSSKKLIAELFEEGDSLFKYPLKLIYIIKPRVQSLDSPAQFSISVPKRLIKTAVKRNLIKRRVREAYRLNKYELYEKIPADKQLVFMLVFVGKQPESYEVIEKAVKDIIYKFKAP